MHTLKYIDIACNSFPLWYCTLWHIISSQQQQQQQQQQQHRHHHHYHHLIHTLIVHCEEGAYPQGRRNIDLPGAVVVLVLLFKCHLSHATEQAYI